VDYGPRRLVADSYGVRVLGFADREQRFRAVRSRVIPDGEPSREAEDGPMFQPTVTEMRIELESVMSDPFIADLDRTASSIAPRLSAPAEPVPGRRIYD
jgi:hypothetical protein